MARFVFSKGVITIGTVALSAELLRSVSIEMTSDMPEVTAMGVTWRDYLKGLKAWSGTIELNQDYATNKTDSVFWTAFDGESTVDFKLKQDSGAASVTNPQYEGKVVITGYTPVMGAAGDAALVNVSYQGAGQLTRVTS